MVYSKWKPSKSYLEDNMEEVSLEKEMNLLLNNFWITKEENKEDYYLLKKNQDKIREFMHRTAGNKLIVHDRFIKLEKIPANARKEYSINDFTKVLDYVILFIMLIYLEEKTRGDKFILSELIEYIKNTAITLKLDHIPNWDNAIDRRSLIRVLDYLIGINVIFLRDQDNKSFQEHIEADALYEATGLANYVIPSFDFEIYDCKTPEDFLDLEWKDQDFEKGEVRKYKVYRHLLYAPATTKDELTRGEEDYVKHLHKMIEKELQEKINFEVEITKNMCMTFTDEYAVQKEYFPNTKNMSDLILLINKTLKDYRQNKNIEIREDETFTLSRNEFDEMIRSAREEKTEYFSKKYTDIPLNKLLEEIYTAMEAYHFIMIKGETVIVYPLVDRFIAKLTQQKQAEHLQLTNEGEFDEL